MRKFESGEALAKEIGIPASKLKKVFDDYMAVANGKAKDPFGKEYHTNYDFNMNQTFHVALMTPVLHYTMGGVEINDQSEIISADTGKPIPGLFACGELAGGVHGANRLGGSSLLGCVVFGRVAGNKAASYLLKGLTSGSIANSRLNQVANHLETKIRIDPESKKAFLEFSWAGDSSSSSGPAQSAPAKQGGTNTADGPGAGQKAAPQKKAEPTKEYTLDDVAKHNKKEDVWVVVNGQVLDVTKFLPDHPGGPKAILLYAGRDATEEFNMLHDKGVIAKYAPDVVIGTLKK